MILLSIILNKVHYSVLIMFKVRYEDIYKNLDIKFIKHKMLIVITIGSLPNKIMKLLG